MRRTEPNWELLEVVSTPEYKGARRAEIVAQTAKSNSIRMKIQGIESCILEAGGNPATATGAERKRLIATGRQIKARAKSQKQASVKRLHGQRLRQAMPPWADKQAIQRYYDDAARLTAETGIPHEVDHIEPLIRPESCGLHVEYNLRVITRTANRQKGNRRP